MDLVAGLAVAVVALPLALGFAVTTGAAPSAGIATAVIAGAVAAIAGGSQFQVSGPTGAMTVVLVPIVAVHGVSALAPVGVIAGLLMALAGIARLGRWMEKVPWSVMEGFTLGIALTIALQQLPLVLASTRAPGSEALLVAWRTFRDTDWDRTTGTSIALVAFTLAVKFGWRHFTSSRHFRVHVPASIVAVVATTALVLLLDLRVSDVGSLPVGSLFSVGVDFSSIGVIALLTAGVSVALLGGIESLLSARMADAMVHRRDGVVVRPHQPDRELMGQGLATVAASVLGGMPATGAIARTSVNIHAGARTRWASVFHALLVLVFVLFLAPVVAQIPMAALAGVLLGTSWRIASPESIREALRTIPIEQATYLVTAVAVLAIDLIWGIVIGVLTHLVLSRWGKKRRLED